MASKFPLASVVFLAALSCGLARFASAEEEEARRVADYERELKQAMQVRKEVVAALQTLLQQDQALRLRIATTAASANAAMRQSERMAPLREVPNETSRKNRDKDEPATRILDQRGTKSALAMNAMQLASALPYMNAALWQNNAALTKVVNEGNANLRQFRMLADPFGRRSRAEAEKAVELMTESLLSDAQNDGAKLVLGFAHRRLGKLAAARDQFSALAETEGPCQVVAMAARGHMQIVTEKRRDGFADFTRAVALKSGQAEPLLFRALANWQEEKWTTMESDFKSALRLEPDHVDALRLMAHFYAVRPGNQKLAEAETSARRACDLTNEQDGACLEALAAVQARAGNWESAIATQEKATKVRVGDDRLRAEEQLAEYRANHLPSKQSPLIVTPVANRPVAPANRQGN